MRIVVVGAGAIGSLFGALLQRAGHDVTLVGRPNHVAAIVQHGLRLEGRTVGTFEVRATAELSPGFEADLCLLTVKTYDLDQASEVFGRAVSTPLPVAALENGLGVETTVEQSLESAAWRNAGQWIVRGINSIPATFVRPGVVRHTGEGELLLADYQSGRHADATAGVFRSAGVRVRVVSDRAIEVWRKVLVNAAINPVTADHRIANGVLLLDPYREQTLQLLREALTVARAEGMTFTDSEAEAELWRVVRATSDNRSSMLQDLEQGRRTEIDAISGAVLARGEAHGLELPATRRMVQRIHAKEPRRPA
ncbi:MAG: 2-dehydropantoate 2-reductase [Thermoplasmata archaeon]|nr:2-dehydropantoate 2-reductase [Thermoplasmata archaeon]